MPADGAVLSSAHALPRHRRSVSSRREISSALLLYLLFTLLAVAGLYFLLEAEFLAAVQLVVYAGGTLILIVFGVMLTSKSPFNRFEPTKGEVIVGIVTGVIAADWR